MKTNKKTIKTQSPGLSVRVNDDLEIVVKIRRLPKASQQNVGGRTGKTDRLKEVSGRDSPAVPAPAPKQSQGAELSGQVSPGMASEADSSPAPLFEVSGWLGSNDPRLLRLGPVSIFPDKREFALLLILASHKLTRAGLPTPREINGPEFLPTEAILDEFAKLRNEVKGLAGILEAAGYNHVHRLVCRLRQKIEAQFKAQRPGTKAPELIETGPQGGYRLNVAAAQIRIKPESYNQPVPRFRQPGKRPPGGEKGAGSSWKPGPS